MSKNINNGGHTLKGLAKSENASIAINASGFAYFDKKIVPYGTVIRDGKVLFQNGKMNTNMGLIGFNITQDFFCNSSEKNSFCSFI